MFRSGMMGLLIEHPDILYIREQEREDPWLFFEITRGQRAERFAKQLPKVFYCVL
jgi:hypothetical protein